MLIKKKKFEAILTFCIKFLFSFLNHCAKQSLFELEPTIYSQHNEIRVYVPAIRARLTV